MTVNQHKNSIYLLAFKYTEILTTEMFNYVTFFWCFLLDVKKLVIYKNMQQNNSEARSGQAKPTKRGKKPAGSSKGLAGGM